MIVDCSGRTSLNCDALIEWIRLYPRGHDIHVLLPSLRERREQPRLRRALQQLGCTVTARATGVA